MMTGVQIQSLPITVDLDILGSTPVFSGTRVPVRSVFDYVADGCSLDEFLENFPTVLRADAIAVLDAGGSSLVDQAQQK
jgi:uncharacterized protein (DUF433 family)